MRLTGKEAISEPFKYQLELLSHDASIPLKYLQGQAVAVSILQADGSYKPACCGIVNKVGSKGSCGGFAKYVLEIIPALDLLKHTNNSRIFNDKTVPEILTLLLQELCERHPSSRASLIVVNQLTKEYPRRRYIAQYRESTFAFFTRLAREEGISYRHAFTDSETPSHKIIFFDDCFSLEMTTVDDGKVRFHRAEATENSNTLDLWESERSTQPARTTLNSWVYQSSHIDHSSEATWIDVGDTAPQLENYDPQTSHYGDETELSDYTKLRQQAHDLKTKTFFAAGNVPHLNSGDGFTLTQHPVHDQDPVAHRQFIVLAQEVEANNNLGSHELAAGSGNSATDNPPFRTKLTLVRRGIPIVPEFSHTEHAKPRSRGPQTAMVVGIGSEVHTNERGEIRVQYPWQRKQDHLEGGADFDDKSSFWVRVAHDIAGSRWGSQWIPRIGQEVLIDFIEGDIDRPVCVKVLHNARHENPHFSGTGSLPANKALSGTKTKEFDGQGYNELLFDDTTGEQRTKFSSEHAKSQLNLGYLIHPRTEGRGEPRGEGIEIRTDASLALRSAMGTLITTEARYKASGKQLDRQALTAAMNAAKELVKIYGDLSNTHQADNTDLEELKKLIDKIAAWEKGSNTDKNNNGGGQPIVAVSAPGGMAISSGEEMAITSGTNLDIVTQQSTQITAGKNLLARVKDRISLFTYKLGIKIIAASGKVEIQAHSDNIELTAAKNIFGTALEEITWKCKKFTIITDGASYEIGAGGIISKTSGAHVRHAGKHTMTGPAGVGVAFPALPSSGEPENWSRRFIGEGQNASAIANVPYQIKKDDGQLLEGVTDERGRTQRFFTAGAKPLEVIFGESEWTFEIDDDSDKCC